MMRNLYNRAYISSIKFQFQSGKKEVLRKRLKNYHKQLNLNRENLIQKSNTDDITSPQVDYDYVCVIDFEATCDDVNTNNYPHEIIEFPIVLVNMHTRQIVILSI